MTRHLLLASGSPRRRELLASLGIDFTVVRPQVNEDRLFGEAPLTYVERLSWEKADAIAAEVAAPSTILAADTIVVLAADTIGIGDEDEILGKPANAEEARAMLRSLRGRMHRVCTAFTLLELTEDALEDESERGYLSDIICTNVWMRDYSDAEIDAYVASGDPLDKAGAYAIQNDQFHPVERLEGCYTNVVGLPLCAVRWALADLGWPGITPPDPPESCDCG